MIPVSEAGMRVNEIIMCKELGTKEILLDREIQETSEPCSNSHAQPSTEAKATSIPMTLRA